MANYDYTTDGGCLFLNTLKEAGALPDWVLGVPDATDVAGLPSTSFADTENRLYPLHSKEAAFLSAVSAHVYGETGSPCLNRIKTACHAYGIVDHVKTAHAALTEEYHGDPEGESQNYKYALELNDGERERLFYPIHTAGQTELSAIKLATDMAEERLPVSWFAPAARAIVKAAAEQEVPFNYIPEAVLALGEDRMPSRSYLEHQIGLRKKAGLADEAVAVYKEAAEGVLDGRIAKDDGSLVWELADRKFDIKPGGPITMPAFAFNSGLDAAEFAKRANAVFMLHDVVIPVAGLRAVPEAVLATSFSKEAAAITLAARESEGLEATSLLKQLNDTDQRLLLRILCNAAGKTV
jgi:hypothetical protein